MSGSLGKHSGDEIKLTDSDRFNSGHKNSMNLPPKDPKGSSRRLGSNKTLYNSGNTLAYSGKSAYKDSLNTLDFGGIDDENDEYDF